MLAIIGSGEELLTEPIVACEYNMKTGVMTLIKPDYTKAEVNTKIDRVSLAENGRICNTFNGEVKITNPRSGLSKTINTNGYTPEDYLKTFRAYVAAGYRVEIIQGVQNAAE